MRCFITQLSPSLCISLSYTWKKALMIKTAFEYGLDCVMRVTHHNQEAIVNAQPPLPASVVTSHLSLGFCCWRRGLSSSPHPSEENQLQRMCVSPLSHAWLCNPMDWSLPGSFVHGSSSPECWSREPFSCLLFHTRLINCGFNKVDHFSHKNFHVCCYEDKSDRSFTVLLHIPLKVYL